MLLHVTNLLFRGCGLLDGKLSRYLNAFSIMLPGISHLGYLDRIQSDGAHKYLERWTLSPDGTVRHCLN